MKFFEERQNLVLNNSRNIDLLNKAKDWHDASRKANYAYMFESFNLPIIQDPQDICMLQEIIWKTKPTVIIETGVARGGSIVLSAAILAVLNYCDILHKNSSVLRKVIGVDIDIRQHNRKAILDHPLAPMIELIEGSSIDQITVNNVISKIPENSSVMVILDSNHSEEHVLNELNLYSKLVSDGFPLIVMDTGIEFAPNETLNLNRPWCKGNNPYTAVQKFLKKPEGRSFSIDREIEKRHIITCAPEGILFKKSEDQ